MKTLLTDYQAQVNITTADGCWLKIVTSLQVHTILRRVKHMSRCKLRTPWPIHFKLRTVIGIDSLYWFLKSCWWNLDFSFKSYGWKVFTNIVSMLTTGVSCALGAAVYFFIFTMTSKFDSSLELSPFDQAILQIVWRNEKGHIGNTWRHIFFNKRGMAQRHSIFL
jgi:hypothetical protein